MTARETREVAYIALGSNLGNREAFLEKALAAIAALPETDVLAVTPAEETAPIGPPGQGPYLNQMLAVSTGLEPRTLLAALHDIENEAGRKRGPRWGSRTLDLDIVLIEGRSIDTDDLKVPHPELPKRDFWLRHLEILRGRRNG